MCSSSRGRCFVVLRAPAFDFGFARFAFGNIVKGECSDVSFDLLSATVSVEDVPNVSPCALAAVSA